MELAFLLQGCHSPPVFQLLRDYEGQPIDGWLMSEKLDGWRVMWNGAEFILRGGGVLRVPDRWKAGMPSIALDGELFAGRGEFDTIQGRIARGCHGLTFQVFDAPMSGTFRQRLALLKSLSLPEHVGVVAHVRCRDTRHLIEHADAIVTAGGEGAVVRRAAARYALGRSGDVLRWVPQCPRVNRLRVAS
jgi:DNA ligase-1